MRELRPPKSSLDPLPPNILGTSNTSPSFHPFTRPSQLPSLSLPFSPFLLPNLPPSLPLSYNLTSSSHRKAFIEQIRQALYASKIVSYAQGFMLLREAAKGYGWNLNYGGIALMWRGGCIIRRYCIIHNYAVFNGIGT